VVEENLNKTLYKSVLILLRFIPFIIALIYVVYTAFAFFGIDLIILGYLAHMSILPWIFIFLASFVFRFCIVHRLPLYYIVVADSITTLDAYVGIPLEWFHLLMLHAIIVGAFIFLILYFHQKRR
jgi:hypothetical protein